VLVVEDETDLRSLVTKVLSEKGYKVLTAVDGQQALRIGKNRKGRIDLLLTDVVMPGMRGQQLAEELAKIYPQMHVVYMSGYTDNALMHAGSLEPGTIFLQKPFTPDVILRKVRSVLDESKSQQESKRRAV
jgi:DNA-binding NtrC family response regulator